MELRTFFRSIDKLRSAFVISIIVFFVLNTLLFLYWQNEHRTAQALQEKTFVDITNNITDSIVDRTDLYINALIGGRALFDASDFVSRDAWRAYTTSIDLTSEYPGVQGFGYAEVIAPDQLPDYIEEIRASGFPEFTVRPEGEREIYTSITYLEPFDIRNQQAFGFDMFSEETRRIAMQQARDTGKPHMSGKVILVQEIDQDVQPGFLIYVPRYEKDMPLNTIEEKRTALLGYVYSPFRMTDFMEGIIKRRQPVDFAVFDGARISEETKLYDSGVVPRNFDEDQPVPGGDGLERVQEVSLGNHTWTIYYNSLPDSRFVITSKDLRMFVLLFGFLLNSLVVYLLFRYLINKQNTHKKT